MRLPTKAEWLSAGRWIKDHSPAFTVSFIAFSGLWTAVVLACLTLFVFDASFYRSLAPPGMELQFQSIGVCFRFVVIFGGLAIIYGKQNNMPKAAVGTLRFLFLLSFCAVMVSALGYVSEGGDYHYRKNAAIGQTEVASTENADTIIARAETEKAAIRSDRDQLVAAARTSMNLVLDDGNSRNDDVSTYEKNIALYQTEAQAKLDALDDKIEAAEASRLQAKQKATQLAVGDPGLATVYRFPERYIQSWDGISFRDGFNLFWVILLECIGAFGAQALLTIQVAMSKRKQAQENGSRGGRITSRRRLIEDLRKARGETKADLTEDKETDDGNRAAPPQAAE